MNAGRWIRPMARHNTRNPGIYIWSIFTTKHNFFFLLEMGSLGAKATLNGSVQSHKHPYKVCQQFQEEEEKEEHAIL